MRSSAADRGPSSGQVGSLAGYAVEVTTPYLPGRLASSARLLRLLSLVRSLGAAGARENARSELERACIQREQAALVARHVHTLDSLAAQRADDIGDRQPVVTAA